MRTHGFIMKYTYSTNLMLWSQSKTRIVWWSKKQTWLVSLCINLNLNNVYGPPCFQTSNKNNWLVISTEPSQRKRGRNTGFERFWCIILGWSIASNKQFCMLGGSPDFAAKLRWGFTTQVWMQFHREQLGSWGNSLPWPSGWVEWCETWGLEWPLLGNLCYLQVSFAPVQKKSCCHGIARCFCPGADSVPLLACPYVCEVGSG